MDPYDTNWAPVGFGLNNPSALCYLNAFLQTLAGLTSLTKAVLAHADYLSQTKTGAAFLSFVQAFATEDGARARPAEEIAFLSERVLAALTADLQVRRPWFHFGNSQESASEAFVLFLDMMEPPSPETDAVAGADGGDAAGTVHSAESPITALFLHRFRCDLHCRRCKLIVTAETDYAVIFNLFHFDRMRVRPTTMATFSKAVRCQISATEDYKCEECYRRQQAAAAPGTPVVAESSPAFRVYNLTMVPEIVFCAFNLYVGYGGVRRVRYFPDRLEFPAVGDGKLVYRLVGQIEHSGALTGGHYWAYGLRAGERVYRLNDTGVDPAAFTPTDHTYIVAYHYVAREEAPPAAPLPAPPAMPSLVGVVGQ
jgi:hypothetical protein